MKKIIVMLMTAALVLPASCTMDEPAGGQPATSQKGDIEITVADFVDADGAFGGTRSTISPVEGKPGQFAFNWVTDDEIGVFPNFRADKGQSSVLGLQQLMVTVGSDTNGQTIGTTGLSGTSVGWRIETGREYAAYYPMIEQYEQTPDAIHFNYSGQVQNSNDSLAHLGAKDFLVAAPCTATQKSGSEYGQLKFKFSHVGAVVRIRHKMTEGGTFSAMTLQIKNAEKLIPIVLNADLFAESQISEVASGKNYKFTVALNNYTVKAGEDAYVWCMFPPVDLTDKKILITFKGTGATADVAYVVSGKNFQGGSSYAVNTPTSPEPYQPSDFPDSDSFDYVDLGLPSGTLWATKNVGATYPEDPGGYYAWGDTETKSIYSDDTYSFYDGGKLTSCNKYNTIDNFSELKIEDDVAAKKWGNGWRIPSDEDWNELLTECTISANFNTDKCFKITGKNGNYIYLPMNGYYSGSNLYYCGLKGRCYYWTRDHIISNNASSRAAKITMNVNTITVGHPDVARYRGLGVRPVRKTTNN